MQNVSKDILPKMCKNFQLIENGWIENWVNVNTKKKSLGHSKYNECNSKPLKYYNLRLSKQLYDDGSQGPQTVPLFFFKYLFVWPEDIFLSPYKASLMLKATIPAQQPLAPSRDAHLLTSWYSRKAYWWGWKCYGPVHQPDTFRS